MEQDILQIATQINNLSIIYDHKDWETILFNTDNEISKPVGNITFKNKLPWLDIRVNTELYDSSLCIKLLDVHEASCGVAHMKFSLNTFAGIILYFISLYSNIHILKLID